jgi:peroxidase
VNGIESEKASQRSLGMRNFKYVNTIKAALESECPVTVSCADIVALSARDGIVMVRVYIYTSRNQSTMKSKTGNLRDLILKCDYS